MNEKQRDIFKANILRLLQRKGKTQAEVADYLGVSPQSFSAWCQGKAYPRIDMLVKIADYFGVYAYELMQDQSNKVETEELYWLSSLENEIIEHYRKLSPTEQNMILRMLGIEEKRDEENVC